MEKQQLQKIYDLENTSDEKRNMGQISYLISRMGNIKSTIIYNEQLLEHNEECYVEEVEKEKQQAEDEYSNLREELKTEMRSKDSNTVKEYLDLIQQDSNEKLASNKSPLYLPPEKRDFSVEQMDEYIEKRELKAQCDAVQDARRDLHFSMQKQDNRSK